MIICISEAHARVEVIICDFELLESFSPPSPAGMQILKAII